MPKTHAVIRTDVISFWMSKLKLAHKSASMIDVRPMVFKNDLTENCGDLRGSNAQAERKI